MVRSIFSLRGLLYLLYGLVLTAVLIYVRFPTEKFRQFCEDRFEKYLPGTAIAIDSVGYRFPLSAVMKQVSIRSAEENNQSGLVIKQFVVTARPPRVASRFYLDGDLLGGKFTAKFNLDRLNNGFQLYAIDLHGVDIGGMIQSLGIADREVAGIAEFTGAYQADNEHPLEGSGKGSVKIVDGSVGLLQPILGLSAIAFESVVIKVAQDQGIISLTEAKLLGKEIIADFTGKIQAESPIVNSALLLSGQLVPQETFLQNNPQERDIVQRLQKRYNLSALPFKVGGTINRPLFRFSK